LSELIWTMSLMRAMPLPMEVQELLMRQASQFLKVS
jgi:hypothetical protein